MATFKPNGHAVLSASGAARWLACTPSARLEEGLPDTTSAAAAEGTLAHAIGELLIARDAGKISKVDYAFKVTPLINDSLYTPAMMGHLEDYAAFVLERYSAAQAATKDAILEQEIEADYSRYVPEGKGTLDNSIIADGTLEIIDLKFGKGVEVSAENNPQMKLYALGALEKYDWLYTIDRVKMTIYQPRIDNFSTWVITVKDLREWAEGELKQKADLAFKGDGDFVPGKHCQFCKVRATCRANAAYQTDIARTDFLEPVLLSDADIADILTRAAQFENWLKAVKDYALNAAVKEGRKFPGLKLVEGRSNRVYADPVKIADVLTADGWTEADIFEKKLLGVTAMQGVLSKKVFDNLVGPYIIKPPGKPTLVPDSDKRAELNSLDAVRADFEIDDL